jgi:hypothetical protein
MAYYPKRPLRRNFLQYELFDGIRERELRTCSRAARAVALRHGISVHHAEALVLANGLGVERSR